MALGFSVDGQAKEGEIVHKAIPEPGQAVILTKGIGTGAIMAASMQRKAQASWVAGALESMQQSSAAAVQCLQRHGVTACTDVTGFGLLGHLVEMARPSQVPLMCCMESCMSTSCPCTASRSSNDPSCARFRCLLRLCLTTSPSWRGAERSPVMA